MSLPKLTSLSTQTLSLLLERQRLQSLSASGTGSRSTTPLHLQQITRNLKQLRTGVLELESKDGKTEASKLLREQYERMRGMLGVDGQEGIERLPDEQPQMMNSNTSPFGTPPLRLQPSPPVFVPRKEHEPVYARYSDDPEAGYGEPSVLLQTQQRLMDDQDGHLEQLSHSINRQRDISLQINDELDVHTGLLEELDTELDHTEGRLSGARRRLERVARGTKENGSTVMIVVLILVLLILIIAFKT